MTVAVLPLPTGALHGALGKLHAPLPSETLPALPLSVAYNETCGLPAADSESKILITMQKSGKGRCGLGLQQNKKSLIVSAVTPSSIGAEAGFLVGDVILSIQTDSGLDRNRTVPVEELRYSKHKANAMMFDAKAQCVVAVSGEARRSGHGSSSKVVTARADRSSRKPASIRTIPEASANTAAAIAAAEARVAEAAKAAKHEAAVANTKKRMAGIKAVNDAQAEAKAAIAKVWATGPGEASQASAEAVSATPESSPAPHDMLAPTLSLPKQQAHSTTEATAKPAKVFEEGDAVLHDNERTGALEMARVVGVNNEASPPLYTIVTANGHESQVQGDRLTKSAASSATWMPSSTQTSSWPFTTSAAAAPVSHNYPYAPSGPRIGRGHHNYKGLRFHHGPEKVNVPSLALTMRGIGGNAKDVARMGYGAWRRSTVYS